MHVLAVLLNVKSRGMVPTSTLDWHEREATMESTMVRGDLGSKMTEADSINMPALAFNNDDLKYSDYSLETSITVQIWYPTSNAQASSSTFSKAPLLREVPQVKKRLSKKDRDSGSLVTDSKSFQSLKSATPNWLREKPSRQKLTSQLASASASLSLSSSPSSNSTLSLYPNAPEVRGTWKRSTVVCRETGVLAIYSDDRSLLHSIPTTDLLASDIRLVDNSLFSCPNVLGIYSRPSTLHSVVRSPPLGRKVAQNTLNSDIAGIIKEDPIYLCFPTTYSMKRWRALLRSFAKAEVYGPLHKGGTHRCYRQVDMTILEARLNAERTVAPSRSERHLGISSYDNGEENDYSISGALGLMQMTDAKADGASPVKEITPVSQPIERPSTDSDSKPKGTTAPSVKSSDEDSDLELTSGPISGLSGKDRIAESSPRSLKLSLFGDSDRRPVIDNNLVNVVMSSYCLLWFAGELVGQTKSCTGNLLSMTWFDKFSLKDLPSLHCMQIDVMQTGRNTSKPTLLGSINLPLETMRRGEVIEGWFPFWSTRGSRGDAEGAALHEHTSTSHEMVGEIKISLCITEETILPLRKYALVEEALDSVDCISLIETLCKRLEEDRVIAYLVEIYSSKGNIVDRLKELIDIESHAFGDNAALLFRGNTILTRAIDKYQRMFCRDWLDACIGKTVRRICRDRIHLESNDERHYYHVPPIDDERVKSTSSTHVVAESNLEALKRICRELWTSIFANRFECPRDLQSTLYKVRTKVNTLQFRPSENNHHLGPGIQGVGAFIFLRLICPAITSPNLYGLMGAAPSAASSKTLMLVAKVFLALANKKTAFDKDKESWLVQANDFLIDQASAYDEFITTVSREPTISKGSEEIRRPLGDEADDELQDKIEKMVNDLPTLPRESIPSAEYLLDRPLALASLCSYVVREASIDSYPYSGKDISPSFAGDSADAQSKQRRYEEFVDLCCDVEDKVGYYIDRAGYKPEPIDFTNTRITTKTMASLSNKRSRSTVVYGATTSERTPISSNHGIVGKGSMQESPKIRRATVSDLHAPHGVNLKQQMQSLHNTSSVGIPHTRALGEDSLLVYSAPKGTIMPSNTNNGARISPGDFTSKTKEMPFQSSHNHLQGNVGKEARSRNSSGSWMDQTRVRSSISGLAAKTVDEDPASSLSSKQRWWKK